MARKKIAETISVTQLFKYFSTEEKCIAWLEQARWNGEPICPHCQGQDRISPAPSKRFTYWHQQCRKHFTVKTGTVMHSSKNPDAKLDRCLVLRSHGSKRRECHATE